MRENWWQIGLKWEKRVHHLDFFPSKGKYKMGELSGYFCHLHLGDEYCNVGLSGMADTWYS